MKNSADSDQMASLEASGSGSTRFSKEDKSGSAGQALKNSTSAMINSSEVTERRHRDGSGRVLDWRLKGSGFELHWHHCAVSLNKTL